MKYLEVEVMPTTWKTDGSGCRVEIKTGTIRTDGFVGTIEATLISESRSLLAQAKKILIKITDGEPVECPDPEETIYNGIVSVHSAPSEQVSKMGRSVSVDCSYHFSGISSRPTFSDISLTAHVKLWDPEPSQNSEAHLTIIH